jgi:hypothetical protein
MLLVLAIATYVKSYSWEHFISKYFLYSKITIIALYLLIDVKTVLWYIFATIACWLFLKEPLFKGETNQIEIKN